jgi:hypothetical protein
MHERDKQMPGCFLFLCNVITLHFELSAKKGGKTLADDGQERSGGAVPYRLGQVSPTTTHGG